MTTSTTSSAGSDLPIPPLELRELVGPTDAEAFDNPDGGLLFPELDETNYRSVVDFGCGCGRVARQLAQQRQRPASYVGIDVHKGMIGWCQQNLGQLPGFSFVHHDVYSPAFNPDPGLPRTAPLPVTDGEASLFLAWSVFTHLVQNQVEWYLQEMARALASDGVAITTWFLFDETSFPMMQDFQHALYINADDPTNAVVYDTHWILEAMHRHGLVVRAATPPEIRGYHWILHLGRARQGEESVALPADDAPPGRMPPPIGRPNPSTLGP